MFRTMFKSGRAGMLGICMGLWSLSGGQAWAVEEPAYEVVRAYPAFELRRYAPYLLAETEVSGDFDAVGNEAFRILADFIFGNNQRQEKMKMTAPVSQRPAAMEIGDLDEVAISTSVTQRVEAGADPDTYVLSFVMPSQYTRETLPEPVDPRVRIREEPARLMAVRRYSGRWTQGNYREHEALLLQAIAKVGLQPVSATVYARYNSPFSLWFLRRNEVLVEVRPPQQIFPD